MSDESVSQRCARCGTEFPATSSPLGLCPACLLKLGMTDPAMAPPSEDVLEAEPAAPGAPVLAGPPPHRDRRPSWRVLTAFGVAAVIIAAVLFFQSQRRREPIAPHANAVRFTVTLPDDVEMLDGAQFAVSADGAQLAVAARNAEGRQRLWVRRLQSLDWRELPRTDGASHPFWSPDSRAIAFFANRNLKRTDVSSALTHTICEAPSGRDGSWSTQDVIVFASEDGLVRVPATGGSPERVTQRDQARSETAHLRPQFLPDGAMFSASNTVLVYREPEPRLSQLTWLNRAGRVLGTVGAPAEHDGFALAPDGRSVAVARRDLHSDVTNIWLIDPGFERSSRLTLGTAHDASPVWAPDGARLAFSSRRENRDDVYVAVAHGGEKEHVLVQSPEPKRVSDWSTDGRFVIYTARSQQTGNDVWAASLVGDTKPQPVDVSPGNQSQAVLSPDGRSIAYVSDESGSDEVFVRGFPAGGRWQISTQGGTRPRWRADGRELFFLSAGRMTAVRIAPESASRVSGPEILFVAPGVDDFAAWHDRFLVQMPLVVRNSRQLHVVLNWASELRR